ncbi:MAG: hypothetical protein ABI920_18125 [Casimicrobiaceae bacterium]
MKELRPGDLLALEAGDYRSGLPLHGLAGTPGRPITISGPQRGAAAVFHARDGHNTVSLVDAAYLVVRNLAIEGHNLPVDGVKAEGSSRFAHDITLENLTIRGHGNNQQTVAISTKCPAWRWTLRGNRILGAGTGMYLGNSDGRAPFVGGLIEHNLVVDTIGYNLQVKHQLPRPDLPGMPTGNSTTIIRHNVFAKVDSGGGREAEAPRPNVLVGHFPIAGTGVEDRYAVYGNFFYQNAHEALFQGEGNVGIYANVFVTDHGDAIRIQPHNDIPRHIVVAFNTILAKETGISIVQREGAPKFAQIVAANVVFADRPIVAAQQRDNVTGPRARATELLRHPFGRPGALDFSLRVALTGGQDAAVLDGWPDGDRDFDGRRRGAGAAGGHPPGAYTDLQAAASWLPTLERKPLPGAREGPR